MKRVANFLPVLMLLCLPLALQAQKRPTYKKTAASFSENPQNLIKLNPLGVVVRTATMSYERVLNENMSIQLGGQYTIPRQARLFGVNILGENGQLNRFAITPEFRYYPSGAAPTGFYVAPFVRFAHTSVSGEIDKTFNEQPVRVKGKVTQNTYSLGAVIGGQWILGKGISLETYIGPYFSAGRLSASSGLTDEDYKVPFSASIPIWLRSGLTVGYTF